MQAIYFMKKILSAGRVLFTSGCTDEINLPNTFKIDIPGICC